LIRARFTTVLLVLLTGFGAFGPTVGTQGTLPHTLYFAEGATGFFTTSIDLVNPSASVTATATVTFIGTRGRWGRGR
jgi:hypothetical protein